MKQKGFIEPLVIAIVAILVLIGGYYLYVHYGDNYTKSYTGSTFSLKYPAKLDVSESQGAVTLKHAVSYTHPNPCDFRGDQPVINTLTDFGVTLSVVNRSLQDSLTSAGGYAAEPVNVGPLSGYKYTAGVEGCGKVVYYLPLSPSTTLVVDRVLVTEFNPIVTNSETYLGLPGIIPPSKAEEIFSNIISSVKLK